MAQKSVPRRKTPPKTPAETEHGIRTTLFEAAAIVESVRLAVASQSETLDIETVVDRALSAAARLIDNAASALESQEGRAA